MAVNKTDKDISEIRKLFKVKKIIVGSQRTLKNLKLGKIKKVYLSSNCSDILKDSIIYNAKLGEVPLVNLKYPNDELGLLCKKGFSISVLSVPK